MSSLAELKEEWLEESARLHERRGCGDDGEEWKCAQSPVGCAASIFRKMLNRGDDMWAVIEADKVAKGVE